MKKIFNYIFILLLAIFVVPSIVKADSKITVRVVTNPSSSEPLVTLQVDPGTTVGDLRTLLASEIDMEKYMLLNMVYQVPSDDNVLCDYALSCYGPEDGKMTNIYLMEVDNTEKNITLKSIPPKDDMAMYGIYEVNYEMFDSIGYYQSCTDDTFTTCEFWDYITFKAYTNVKITYDYDATVAEIAQKAVDDGLLNNDEFEATDVELLNYILYGGSLANYTSSFKNQLSNYNFNSIIDQRGGASEPFNTIAIGFYMAEYNGVLYAIKDFVEINAPHIIYVPNDATNKVEAVKNRLKDIFGEDASMISVTESEQTINELLASLHLDTVGDIGDETYVILTNENENSYFYGIDFYFAVLNDSSKINNSVSFKSSDLLTNVSVETDESLPLDTIIGVNHITSGDTYNNIIKVLNVEEGEVFDINLSSISQEKSITKLDNGKFLVKIPVPEKYNGKDLIVYYVDSSNAVTPYEVTVKDGYAEFETDHFSTYTLTTKSNLINPATGDNIMLYIIILGISSLVLVGIPVYNKNRK